MRFSLRVLLLCIVIVFGSTSCSGVKNREKKSTDESAKGATISVKVISRSTTTGSKTSDNLDTDIEKKITKTLTKSLINGQNAPALFSKEALAAASSSFPNNKAALKNEVVVSFSFWSNNDKDQDIVVADISQTVRHKTKPKIVNKGKIYFDSSGLIIGFDLDKTTPDSETSNTKDQA